jgi:RimJ/RimL family protein N-acetyltransferase
MASAAIPAIETERLLLRGPAPGDVDAWATCVADPEFNRFMPAWDLSPHARAESKLTAFQQGWEQDPVSHIGWVITTKTDGRLIGLCDTDAVNETSDGEVGYWMCPGSWGQGFTTEAARAAVRYAFEHTTWDRMVAAVIPENMGSVRVLEHLGFVHEREMDSRDYMLLNGMPTLELPSPTLAIYVLPRDRFAPGDALYRVRHAFLRQS